MEDNVTLVFHGFLNLANLEKLKLTKEINRYFDATGEREAIRRENDEAFAKIGLAKGCICCGAYQVKSEK